MSAVSTKSTYIIGRRNIDSAADVENALDAEFDRHLMGEAKALALVERVINDTDGRADEDEVLRRFQKLFLPAIAFRGKLE